VAPGLPLVFEYQNDANALRCRQHRRSQSLDGRPWSTSSTLDDIRGIARGTIVADHAQTYIDLYSGEWCGNSPDNAGAWFSAYRSMILKCSHAQEL
jgi:hypothetical protein